jgi:apolipoprotein N-acyltransferase
MARAKKKKKPEASVLEPSSPPIDRRELGRQVLLAVLGGTLYFVGFVGFGQLYLTWFCFVPALIALEGTTPKRAFFLGTIFGFVLSIGGFYWVAHLLHEFANLNWFLSGLGLVLLCGEQALSIGIVFWLLRRADRDFGLAAVWSLPIALVAVEHAFPVLFPYYVGASQVRFVAITQIAEIFGVLSLAALIALVNGAFYEIVSAKRHKRPLRQSHVIVPAAVFVGSLAYGLLRIAQVDAQVAAAPKMKVAMIQTNLGAKDKADKASEFIRRHVAMTKEAIASHPDLDLVVWPESAYNRWLPRSTKNVSKAATPGVSKPVLFGALTWDAGEDGRRDSTRSYNTAILTSSTGDVLGMFDKVVLLAFGETIPFIDTFPQIKKWFPRSSSFARGTRLENLVMSDGTKLLPMICYEDIIPPFVREMWKSAGPPDVLVNITNDSWYGDSHEPIEHLSLAVFRTIETRRALIRTTNTGITALVDPVGRIVKRTGQWTQETLIGEVPKLKGETTPYLVLGDVLGWASLLAIGGALLRARLRRR